MTSSFSANFKALLKMGLTDSLMGKKQLWRKLSGNNRLSQGVIEYLYKNVKEHRRNEL